MRNNLCCVTLFLATASFTLNSTVTRADDPKRESAKSEIGIEKQLVGTWVMTEAQRPGNPSGINSRLQFFTGTHWVVSQPDPKTGEIIFHHGGRYTIVDGMFQGTTDFASSKTKNNIGSTFKTKFEVNGDTMKQIDPNGVRNETWQRVKPNLPAIPEGKSK